MLLSLLRSVATVNHKNNSRMTEVHVFFINDNLAHLLKNSLGFIAGLGCMSTLTNTSQSSRCVIRKNSRHQQKLIKAYANPINWKINIIFSIQDHLQLLHNA